MTVFLGETFKLLFVAALLPISGVSIAVVLEKVIAIAKKREQNLQDVSVAATVFTGNALRELNMTSSTDIAAQTRGFNVGTPVGEGGNPISRERAYTTVNVRIGYDVNGSPHIAAVVKNVGDEEYRDFTVEFTRLGGFNQTFFHQIGGYKR